MRKKFMIAVGVGALLAVAQTAVSAIYNPLDRATATATNVAASPGVVAKSVNRAATAFDTSYTPLTMASDASTFRFDGIAAPTPPREEPITDRVSGNAGRYNTALDAVTQEGHCVKSVGFKGKTVPRSSEMSRKCGDSKNRIIPPNPYLSYAIGGVALAAVIAVADDGESD